MTTELLETGPDLPAGEQPPLGPLARSEAWRIVSSPAIPILVGYLVLLLGLDMFGGGNESASLFGRDALADLAAYICLLFLGPMTFVTTHLIATSARRSGSERQLSAAPVDQRRRDLGLCLGVLVGPAAGALALAASAAWLASGLSTIPADGITVDHWSLTDLAQIPAIVLGAGILGVVIARWLPFAGMALLGFVGLIVGTAWLAAPTGISAVRPWFAPYVSIRWWWDQSWTYGGSQSWHLAYLLALSGLGVCAVAIREREGRARWLLAGAGAGALVVWTGLLQLST